jgi:response regulator RpfG family c-di-GMP phosphodiesterase
MSYKLLLVDDELANIRLLERLFREDYSCLTASSGEEAMELLDQHDVAVILSDQRMPGMTGLELLKRSADRRPHMVRILLTGYTDLEALVEAVNCGLVYMYVSKPWNNEDLKLRVSRAVEHYENNKRQHLLSANNERLQARIRDMKLGFVKVVAGMLQLRDSYLCLHAVRVSKYAELLSEHLELSDQLVSDMTAAAFLHDVGIIGATGEIYPAFGQNEDVATLRKHVMRSADTVSQSAELKEAADLIRYHYENFDGSGGPLGLIGDQIPLAVRVLRVAKTFDLLTSPREEEQGLSHEAAMAKLRSGSGKEFDPLVIQTFSDMRTELTDLIPLGLRDLRFHPHLTQSYSM